MEGYWIKDVVEFPLWKSNGDRANRKRLEEMIERVARGQISADRVEIVRPDSSMQSVQFVYWKKREAGD